MISNQFHSIQRTPFQGKTAAFSARPLSAPVKANPKFGDDLDEATLDTSHSASTVSYLAILPLTVLLLPFYAYIAIKRCISGNPEAKKELSRLRYLKQRNRIKSDPV